MGNLLKLAVILLAIMLLSKCSSESDDAQWSKLITHKSRGVAPPAVSREIDLDECQDFAMLMSVSKLSQKLNKPRNWVKQYYTIPIYADTSLTNPRVVGHGLPGGDCFIIRQEGSWFYVQSPLTSEPGWLSRDFVVGFIKKDPVTSLPC